MRIFVHSSLIISQSLCQRLEHSRYLSHHSITGEWVADKGMRLLHRTQLVLKVDISPQFPLPSKDTFKTPFHLQPIRDTGNFIPSLSWSLLVNNKNHSKIRPQTTGTEEGNSTKLHLSPADTLTITLDISENLGYRDTGHQDNSFTGIRVCSGSWISTWASKISSISSETGVASYLPRAVSCPGQGG